jgi:hypothetical protein
MAWRERLCTPSPLAGNSFGFIVESLEILVVVPQRVLHPGEQLAECQEWRVPELTSTVRSSPCLICTDHLSTCRGMRLQQLLTFRSWWVFTVGPWTLTLRARRQGRAHFKATQLGALGAIGETRCVPSGSVTSTRPSGSFFAALATVRRGLCSSPPKRPRPRSTRGNVGHVRVPSPLAMACSPS